MNEFIVWDRRKKEWLKDNCVLTKEGSLLKFPSLKMLDSVQFEVIRPIGKRDINGNKIYADSSIIEFEYPKYKVGTTIQDGYNTYIGHFKFNDNTLSYMVYTKNADDSGYRWHFADIFSQIKNIKIIDTIQENKLGLIT